MRVACVLVAVVPAAPAVAATAWESIGPDGGDLFGVEVSPADPDTLYALSFLAVFRSTDRAATWAPIHRSEMGVGLLSLAFDPADATHVYLATAGTGVWGSTDSGDSWANCTAGLPTLPTEPGMYYPIVSLVSLASGDLLAGLQHPDGQVAPPAWIYRSTDGCAWAPDDDGIALAAGPFTQSVAALLSHDAAGTPWAMVHGAGVYRRGASAWVEENGDLPPEAIRGTFLAHDPLLAGHLLLGTERDWIHESWNGGGAWAPLALPVALQTVSPLPLVYDIAIDPSNTDFVYAFAHDGSTSGETPIFTAQLSQVGGAGGYLTANGGADWPLVPLPAFARVVIDPAEVVTSSLPPFGVTTRSKRWYASSYGEDNFRTSDDGLATIATASTGLATVLANDVWLHPDPAPPYGRVLLTAAEEGIRLRLDDGPAWAFQPAAQGTLYTWSFANDPLDPSLLYYSTGHPARLNTLDRGVYRTSLDCFGEGCPAAEQLLSDVGVWRILSTSLQPHRLYAATQEEGLLVSDDRGESWAPMNEGLALPVGVTDLTLSDLGEPLIAGTRSSDGDITATPPAQWLPDPQEAGALYRRVGSTWVPSPDVAAAVYALAADPSDAEHVLAATAQGVYETTDAGASWTSRYPYLPATDVAIDPLRPGTYYAASPEGVLRSTDAGNQWHFLEDGLHQPFALSLAHDPTDGTLFVGTLGGGVFQRPPDPTPQPSVSFGPNPLVFAATPVGLSLDVVATVTNAGEADLTVTGMSTNDAAFTIVDAAFPFTLTPGSWASVTVRFSPAATGPASASVAITSNDPVVPSLVVPVSGEGRAAVVPTLDLQMDGVAGSTDAPSGSSVTVTVDVVAGDYIGETGDVWLSVVRPDGATLWLVEGVGWIESVTPVLSRTSPIVDATPFLTAGLVGQMMGAHELFFALDEEDGVFQGTFSAAGTVTFEPAPPAITASPTALAFGQVAMGSMAGQGFGILNTGEEDLVVDAIDLPIAELEFIAPAPTFPLTILPKAPAVIAVRFTPSAEVLYATSIAIHSNDPAQPVLNVPVTGQGGFTNFPTPNGLLDGLDGPLEIDEGEVVMFSANLHAGDFAGQDADLLVRRTLPNGTTQWLVEPGDWVTSVTPTLYRSAPLAEETPLFTLALSDTSAGEHELFFAVDDNADGMFDGTWSDTETLAVPEPGSGWALAAGAVLCGLLRRRSARSLRARGTAA